MVPVTYAMEVLADGPASYLRCDDASGTVFDEGGLGLVGWSAFLYSASEPSLIRDGVQAWATQTSYNIQTSDTIGSGTITDWTVEGWFKFDFPPDGSSGDFGLWNMGSLDNAYLQITQNFGAGYQWFLNSNNESVDFGVHDVFDGNPHHIVVVYSSSIAQVDLYIDGVTVSSQSISNPAFETFNGQTWASANFGSFGLAGVIDELAIYDYAIGVDRVEAHWDAGKPDDGLTDSTYSTAVATSAPLHYWKMDEASGTTLAEYSGGPSITISGATVGVTGADPSLGTAVSFDGFDDFGRVSSVDLSGVAKCTVEYFLLWDVNGNNDDLSLEYGENNANDGFAHDPNGSSSGGSGGWAAFGRNTGGGFYEEQIASRPSAAVWHHFAVVLDRTQTAASGGQVTFYLDGAPVASTSVSGAEWTGNFGGPYPLMVMGRSTVGNGTKGLLGSGDMQHLAIYDRDLTSTEISDHYAAAFGAGSSRVTATWQSSYKVRTRTSTTWQSSYKVRARPTATTWQSSYKVRLRTTTAWQSSYKVRLRTTTAWQSSYKVRTRPAATTWQSSYKVRLRTNAAWQSSYKARVRTSATWQSSYDVASPERVTSDWESSYAVRARITTAWASSYALRTRLTPTWQSSYVVRTRIAPTWQSSYAVRIRLTASWASGYAARTRPAVSWASSYIVRRRVTDAWQSSFLVLIVVDAPPVELPTSFIIGTTIFTVDVAPLVYTADVLPHSYTFIIEVDSTSDVEVEGNLGLVDIPLNPRTVVVAPRTTTVEVN